MSFLMTSVESCQVQIGNLVLSLILSTEQFDRFLTYRDCRTRSWTMLEDLLICVTLLVMYLMWRASKSQTKQTEILPPGPTRWPLVGNLPKFIGLDDKGLLRTIEKILENHGTPTSFGLGPIAPYGVAITLPDDLQAVLNSRTALNKPQVFYSRLSFLRNGLVTLPAKEWQPHRKILQPAFNTRILQSFVGKFSQSADKFCDQLESYVDGDYFKCEIPFARYTVMSLLETLLGLDTTKINQQRTEETMQNVLDEVYAISRRMNSFYTDLIYDYTTDGKQTTARNKSLSEYVHKLMELNDSMMHQQQKVLLDSVDEETRTTFFERAKTLDPDGYEGEVTNLLLAGFSTTALTCCYVLVLLGINPSCQDKVYEELEQIFQNAQGRNLEHDDLKQMVYLEACIKETLRMFPTIPMILRQLEDELKMGEYILPKGTILVMLTYLTHRLPEHWATPDQFNPQHFLDAESKERHPYAFLPFSAGPRNCIGYRYGMLAMKVVLSTLLRRYKVTTSLTMADLGITRMFTLEGRHLNVGLQFR